MVRLSVTVLILSACSCFHLLAAAETARFSADQVQFFENQIRLVLRNKCSGCHNDKLPTSGLSTDSREGILKGGNRGEAAAEGLPGGEPSRPRHPTPGRIEDASRGAAGRSGGLGAGPLDPDGTSLARPGAGPGKGLGRPVQPLGVPAHPASRGADGVRSRLVCAIPSTASSSPAWINRG